MISLIKAVFDLGQGGLLIAVQRVLAKKKKKGGWMGWFESQAVMDTTLLSVLKCLITSLRKHNDTCDKLTNTIHRGT